MVTPINPCYYANGHVSQSKLPRVVGWAQCARSVAWKHRRIPCWARRHSSNLTLTRASHRGTWYFAAQSSLAWSAGETSTRLQASCSARTDAHGTQSVTTWTR